MKYALHGRNLLVAGMARSGLAAVELLLRHGALVRAADQRPAGTFRERLQALGKGCR
jgi:UDP-N-acetylmuramoylalanine-D-glutamate ligase